MKTLAVAAMLGVLAVPLAASANALDARQTAAIDRIAAQALAKQHIAGMEIAVGRNGRVLFTRGYGMRDRARRLPVTAQTVFPVGSITKQFTAASMMILSERHKVDLDAKVSTYLPDAPHGNQIPLRDLLDQTSGLPDYLEDKPLLMSIMSGSAGAHSIPGYIGLVKNKPLHFTPGSKFEYSNTNYALAGLIVARASGMPYATFLHDNIFSPLGLTQTQYLRTSVPQGSDVTRGYDYAKGQFRELPDFSMDWGNAAGAIASTASDLVRWDGGFFGGKLIPLAAVKTATTPPAHVPMVKSKDAANNIGIGYAFGWVQARAEGRQMIWHNGGLPGARAMNAEFPRDGLEIVVLTNATQAAPEDVALQIARAIYDAR